MRIGIYTPYLDTLTGGEKYILTIASCLATDHEVHIFWDKNTDFELQEEIKRKFGFDLQNVSFKKNIFSQNISLLKRVRESRSYDYIIFLSDGSIPFVATNLILHFQTPMEWVQYSWKTKLKLSRVLHVICNSQFTKRYIDKKFHIKSEIIYPPVTIHYKEEKKENIILNVGRYGITQAGSSYKKQEFMADSFKKLVDAGVKDWKLLFVVSIKDSQKHELEKLKEHTKDYPIEIIENPTNSVLWQTYSKAKIYWHASGFGEDLEKHPDRAEHFGISTVEAMGCGAVPVVINKGGQSEIVEDNSNGFLWDTESEFLSKTKLLIDSPNKLNLLSEKAKERALDFSKDMFCKAWSNLVC